MKNCVVHIAHELAMYRYGLEQVIKRIEVVGQIRSVATGRQLLGLCEREIPDLIVMDLQLASNSGNRVLEKLVAHYPEVKVIVLSVEGLLEDSCWALQLGVEAVISKDEEPEEFAKAVKCIINNEHYGGKLMSRSVQSMMKYATAWPAFRSSELSSRELMIVELICKEFTNKQIAYELSLSEHTIRNHKVRIMRKMGVKNLSGLVKQAYRMGYVMTT